MSSETDGGKSSRSIFQATCRISTASVMDHDLVAFPPRRVAFLLHVGLKDLMPNQALPATESRGEAAHETPAMILNQRLRSSLLHACSTSDTALSPLFSAWTGKRDDPGNG
jgi:hypothetical protein